MTEPQPGDTIRARRYGNRTRRSYVIDKLPVDGIEGGNTFAAFVRPQRSASTPTLMVFSREGLRIIPRKDQP